MNTRYLTFILRLRLDDTQIHISSRDELFGSVQQIGQQEIHYFDTVEKFEEALQKMLVTMPPPSQTQTDEALKSPETILAATRKTP
jgi:hypothetical protein